MISRDKIGNRIIGKAVNTFCYLFVCFWIGWLSIEGGTSLGSEWGYALDEFLEKMDDSSIAGATTSILWLIVELAIGAFAVVAMTAMSIVGVILLSSGWPLEGPEHEGDKREETKMVVRVIEYFIPPTIIIIVATVATVVSIWKSVFWDLSNKEFTLTCLVSLLPIGVSALWFGFLRMFYKDINKK